MRTILRDRRKLTSALLASLMLPLMTACALTTGSPALVKQSVRLVCFSDAQLVTLTRQQKEALAHNNSLNGGKC